MKRDCAEIQDVLSAYFDQELADAGSTAQSQPDSLSGSGPTKNGNDQTTPRPTVEEVELHLKDCPDCRRTLEEFKAIQGLVRGLPDPLVPDSLWPRISAAEKSDRSTVNLASTQDGSLRKDNNKPWKPAPAFVWATAAAILILAGWIGFRFLHTEHDHREMQEAIGQLIANIDSSKAESMLRNRFGGRLVNAEEAFQLVGYTPLPVESGLPESYSVRNIQVLEMPCCRCTQTVCERSDGSRLFVFEHVSPETGWFENRTPRMETCCGNACSIVEFNHSLAVTWKKGKRYVTLVGVRSREELDLLVARFDRS